MYFFSSDTTGEKDFEEFFTGAETLDMERFHDIGVIKNEAVFDEAKLEYFLTEIAHLRASLAWTKADILSLFHDILPDFAHKETGKYLDARM